MSDTDQSKTKLRLYLLFVAVCIGLALLNYYYNTKRFDDCQQQIVCAFEKSMHRYEQIVPQNVYRQVETISVSNQKHQEEIKALLELQFNKIQNEYETQEVWTGILTIVFLIFSFYSLFKSEEMERQSKLALHSIEESEKGAQKALGSIEEDKKNKLDEIRTEYTKWIAEENKKFGEIIENTQSRTIASMQSEIKKLTEKLETDYRIQTTQYIDKLKENSEKNIEMLKLKNADQTVLFIRGLEEKNAKEIQKQVDLWTAKLNDLKSEFKKIINDIYEEQNPAQPIKDTVADIHSENNNDEPDKESKLDETVTSLNIEEELDEQLPIESDGAK